MKNKILKKNKFTKIKKNTNKIINKNLKEKEVLIDNLMSKVLMKRIIKVLLVINLKAIPNILCTGNRILKKIMAQIKVMAKSHISIINMKKLIIKVIRDQKIKVIQFLKINLIQDQKIKVIRDQKIKVIRDQKIKVILDQKIKVIQVQKIKVILDLKIIVIKNLIIKVIQDLIIKVIKKKEIIVLKQEITKQTKHKNKFFKDLKKNDF